MKIGELVGWWREFPEGDLEGWHIYYTGAVISFDKVTVCVNLLTQDGKDVTPRLKFVPRELVGAPKKLTDPLSTSRKGINENAAVRDALGR